MRPTRAAILVAWGALIVPSWFVGSEWAWEDELKYLGAILAALLVLMVRALRRERQM
ncbi:MAG: hypothetical protein KBH81_10415 [Phycisphaerae bacterium]|nr:hypothetical protein [Phycisphaerae bacterium]HOO17702.1 hypothetical protein [Phycisphaerae bacterium]HPC23203.1 hypothetical protein [Phycisphaerae bacterium]HRS29325.1 hypothetical protein [Phycisphaerae bacterium]HRT43200.1 hypothetical protein [Phycisphaerae bacterium]